MRLITIAIFKTVLALWLAIFLAWFSVHDAFGATARSAHTRSLFHKANACPSTGKFTGACPGWVMDHLKSLRCGGKDVPENLWWQTIAEAKVKDGQEAECWRYYQGASQ